MTDSILKALARGEVPVALVEEELKAIASKETELNEPVLEDDYPVYGDYLYVADGEVYRSGWHGITIGLLKRYEGFKEVRRCDIYGRRERGKDATS